MHKQLVIFDFDGTLVDSSPGIMHAVKMLAERHNYSIPARNDVEHVISKGSMAILNVIIGDATLSTDQITALQKDFFVLYQRYGIFENKLYPGMQEVLDALNSNNRRWAIMSNGRSPLVAAMMSNLKLTGQPASVVCVDQIANRKPAPDGLLKVCTDVKISPEHGVYIGDAITDIQAGKAAGMQTIAALYGYVPADNPADTWGADYMIGAPVDLMELLRLA